MQNAPPELAERFELKTDLCELENDLEPHFRRRRSMSPRRPSMRKRAREGSGTTTMMPLDAKRSVLKSRPAGRVMPPKLNEDRFQKETHVVKICSRLVNLLQMH